MKNVLLTLFSLLIVSITIAQDKANPSSLFQKGNKFYLEENYKDAFPLFSQSAKAGHGEAQFRLGEMYVDGKGVEENHTQAFQWFSKAAESEYYPALAKLIWMYEAGVGVAKDMDKGAYWRKQSLPDESAQPSGGARAMYIHVKKNLKYPRLAERKGITGKVFATFTINEHGAIEHVRIIRGIGGGCDEETVRVIKTLPRWEPAKWKGQPVSEKITFPISFEVN